MLKLLSQSKHEEFESNSALQIKDQKKRRAENTKKVERSTNWVRNCLCVHCSPHALFTPPATVHFSCSYTLLRFCYNFLFLPILTLVIAFILVCFVPSLALSTIYAQSSSCKINFQSINKIDERSFQLSCLSHFLSLFSHFLSFSRHPNTP